MTRLRFVFAMTLAAAVLSGSAALAQDGFKMKRTVSGRPDFSGSYDSGTLTPLNRPERFGDQQFMTKEEAAAVELVGTTTRRASFRPRITW